MQAGYGLCWDGIILGFERVGSSYTDLLRSEVLDGLLTPRGAGTMGLAEYSATSRMKRYFLTRSGRLQGRRGIRAHQAHQGATQEKEGAGEMGWRQTSTQQRQFVQGRYGQAIVSRWRPGLRPQPPQRGRP